MFDIVKKLIKYETKKFCLNILLLCCSGAIIKCNLNVIIVVIAFMVDIIKCYNLAQ